MAASTNGLEMPRASRWCATMTARSRACLSCRAAGLAAGKAMPNKLRLKPAGSTLINLNRLFELPGHLHLDIGVPRAGLDRNRVRRGFGFHPRGGWIIGHVAALLADGLHSAKLGAGRLGIELGLGDGVFDGELARLPLELLRFVDAKIDAADRVRACLHELVEHGPDFGHIAHGHVDRIIDAVAHDARGLSVVVAILILRV